MKTILITLDSLNRHFLSNYGGPVELPVLNELAREGFTFDKHFTGSAPCMPARREILTGTLELRHRGWGPLEPFDNPISRILADKGIPTMLITDHYHYFENGGENYHVDFTGYELIRGHENDNWRTTPYEQVTLNPNSHTGPNQERSRQTYVNKKDYPCAKTFAKAEDWARENGETEDFFLYIDEFDPHEPFMAPQEYLEREDDSGYKGDRLEWPNYGKWKGNDQELTHIRNRYKAKLHFLNDLLQSFFGCLKEHGLYNDTTIILTTDHGHYLGDHGNMGKPATDNWNTLFHIPLFVKPADSLGLERGGRIKALTTSADLCATIAHLNITSIDDSLYGRSFLPLMTKEKEKTRDYVLYGFFGGQLGYCDGKYTYLKAPNKENQPLNYYSTRFTSHPGHTKALQKIFSENSKEIDCFIEEVNYPVIKLPILNKDQKGLSWTADEYIPESLFDLDTDQEQKKPIYDKKLLRTYVQKMKEAMEAERFPEEQLRRLKLD
jgi:arylsulfatase A-like enzyme